MLEVSNTGMEGGNRQVGYPPLPPQHVGEQHHARMPSPRQYPSQPQYQQQEGYNRGLRELESTPHITQQSYAPSQKTLVMLGPNRSSSPQNSHVYQSHATTERHQNQGTNNGKSPIQGVPRVNIEIGSMMRPEGTVKSIVHQSHIPPNRQLHHINQINQIN